MWRRIGSIIIIVIFFLVVVFLYEYTNFDIRCFSDSISLVELVLALGLAFLVERQQHLLNKFTMLNHVPTLFILDHDETHVMSGVQYSTAVKDRTKFRIITVKQKASYSINLPYYVKADRYEIWNTNFKVVVNTEAPITSIQFKSVKIKCGNSLKKRFKSDRKQEIQTVFFDQDTFILTIAACFPAEEYQRMMRLEIVIEVQDITGQKHKQRIIIEVDKNVVVAHHTKLI